VDGPAGVARAGGGHRRHQRVGRSQNLGGALGALLTQPAIVTVPIAFASMIGVSLLTERPADVGAQMLALHAPEGLEIEALERARV
jgi:hypothetical protein